MGSLESLLACLKEIINILLTDFICHKRLHLRWASWFAVDFVASAQEGWIIIT